MTVEAFFSYARERHATYLRRLAGGPPPWTADSILQRYKFTNVFRELDRTTVWFREHVRWPMTASPEVLLATVVFRWFNRISTGEAIFCQLEMFDGETPWDMFLSTGEIKCLRHAILANSPRGPWVTGAYTINTRSAGLGLSKLDGVLRLIEMWLERHWDWRCAVDQMLRDEEPRTLENFCTWATSPCLGPFMTYEVACDLRHTALLRRAPDINTWANLGPGALRGLNRIFRTWMSVNAQMEPYRALGLMKQLLDASRRPKYWPHGDRDWPAWEMREVEHTLCEFDKYERVRFGQGRPRGRFNGQAA